MLPFLAAAAAAVCLNATPEQAGQTILQAFSSGDHACLRTMVVDPEKWFGGGDGDAELNEGLASRSWGGRSTLDIVQDGVQIRVVKTRYGARLLFVSNKYSSDFRGNFRKYYNNKYYMKAFFVCDLYPVGRSWKISKDLCFNAASDFGPFGS